MKWDGSEANRYSEMTFYFPNKWTLEVAGNEEGNLQPRISKKYDNYLPEGFLNSEAQDTIKTDSATKRRQGSTPATPEINNNSESFNYKNTIEKQIKLNKMPEKWPKSMIKPRKILPVLEKPNNKNPKSTTKKVEEEEKEEKSIKSKKGKKGVKEK